jgi:cytochrome c oxidase subunit II
LKKKKWAVHAGLTCLALGALASNASAATAWPWLPQDVSLHGQKIDAMFYAILWITAAVFLLTEGCLLYFIFKYRWRAGGRAHYFHGSTGVEVVWTLVPALILVVLALTSNRLWNELRKGPIPKDALQVEIVAQQFAWNIRYAGADGKFGAWKDSLITDENPRGLDSSDPASKDDVLTQNQLHIPADRPIQLIIRSKDVIHSFFLPELRVKQDAVPGLTISNIWFVATKPGTYDIACAQLCGLAHYRMHGFLTVHTPEDFEKWFKGQVKAGGASYE